MKYCENPSETQWRKLVARNMLQQKTLDKTIREVFKAVEENGDKALLELTYKYDKVKLNSTSLTPAVVSALAKKVTPKTKRAIDEAYENIYKFHRDTVKKTAKIKIREGIECWTETRTIESVGLYVPGGSAPLVSTVLMLGIPAQIAGPKQVLLFTPPGEDGKVNPAICYAVKKCGINKVFTVGGAQAIAALAIGTESIPKVDKIFGPGNQYVTAAKQNAVNYGVAIDMPAGPSEVMVIADDTANAEFVAADLLSQAEHGPDSQTVLLTNSKELAEKVKIEIKSQLKTLPRKQIAERALKNSFIAIFDEKKILEFADFYAPEHLIISVKNPEKIAKEINNAGSVFLGDYSPESAGDYASGTNHTLPTGGWARSYSGLSAADFQRTMSFQKLSKRGLANLSETIETLAKLEGLDAHARAVSVRLKG